MDCLRPGIAGGILRLWTYQHPVYDPGYGFWCPEQLRYLSPGLGLVTGIGTVFHGLPLPEVLSVFLRFLPGRCLGFASAFSTGALERIVNSRSYVIRLYWVHGKRYLEGDAVISSFLICSGS